MKVLSAHQPTYLPYLGLFHKIALADEFIHFDQVQYCSRDWINRNRIKINGGGFLWLTVPVLKSGHREKTIAEMEINNSMRWRDKHWKSIYLAYKKSKYFKEYADFFRETYLIDWRYITDLNKHIFNWFIQVFEIKTKIREASEFNFQGAKSDLVLDMCKKRKADLYIFGLEGRNYADIASFERAEIKPYFQKYEHPTYSQLHGEFIPYMSGIDLIFNEGPNAKYIFMQGNETRESMCGGIRC